MGTINADVSAIKTIQDGLVNNKVARFSYTQKAYTDNIVDGVDTYNVNNEQNIPNGTAAIMKVNDTIINKGYRAQASSITRMLMNHFLGRISYNLNKVNDNMKSLIDSLNSHLGTANGIATLDSDGKLELEQSPVSRFTLIKEFKNITGTGSSMNLGVITPDGLDYLPVGLYMIEISGGSGDVFYLPFAQVKITTNVEFIYFNDRFKTNISFIPDEGKIKPILSATFSSGYPASISIYKIG